jgi:hypothetical protein
MRWAMELHSGNSPLCSGDREAAQIAQQAQRVFVHGVDVEQVVLHAPDDVGEGGDVGGEHPVAVHAPQRMGEPCG